MFETGVNWYVIGQNAKLTLHYRARPIFVRDTPAAEGGSGDANLDSFSSELILQTQILF